MAEALATLIQACFKGGWIIHPRKNALWWSLVVSWDPETPLVAKALSDFDSCVFAGWLGHPP